MGRKHLIAQLLLGAAQFLVTGVRCLRCFRSEMFANMADVAVGRSVSEQVRDIIFDAIKSIRKKSKHPDTISIIEHIT